LLNEKLITGLNDPKGQLVLGDKFYVSDNLELVEVDLNTNKIINKYTDEDVGFLNDVNADANVYVYISNL